MLFVSEHPAEGVISYTMKRSVGYLQRYVSAQANPNFRKLFKDLNQLKTNRIRRTNKSYTNGCGASRVFPSSTWLAVGI